MLFHNFLRALMEAWGHKPKGTTVWELLKEVLQNLPFGVKKQLVEIVPEQSVTPNESYEGSHIKYNIPTPLTDYNDVLNIKKVTVKFNGKEYHCDVFYTEGGGYQFGATDPMDYTEYPFSGSFQGTPEGDIVVGLAWPDTLNETVTISVSTEQEVVIPIDKKFVVPTVFYINSLSAGATLYHADGTKVSYEEAKNAMDTAIIVDKENSTHYRPISVSASMYVVFFIVLGDENERYTCVTNDDSVMPPPSGPV